MVRNITFKIVFFYKLIQQSINTCTQFFNCGWMRLAIMGYQIGLENGRKSGKSLSFFSLNTALDNVWPSDMSGNFEMEIEWQH